MRKADGVHTLVRCDVERLPFPDRSFDTTVATCVFCSGVEPGAGLGELVRVMRDDGQILLWREMIGAA